MAVFKLLVNEKAEEAIQKLQEEYQELKNDLSELRRNGIDTSVAELLIYDFPPAVRMARATYDPKDMAKLRKLNSTLREELDLAKQGTSFSKLIACVTEAYQLLRDDSLTDARALYGKIISLYRELPDDMKPVVYFSCMDLRKKLSAA